jgi:hypothetical protein
MPLMGERISRTRLLPGCGSRCFSRPEGWGAKAIVEEAVRDEKALEAGSWEPLLPFRFPQGNEVGSLCTRGLQKIRLTACQGYCVGGAEHDTRRSPSVAGTTGATPKSSTWRDQHVRHLQRGRLAVARSNARSLSSWTVVDRHLLKRVPPDQLAEHNKDYRAYLLGRLRHENISYHLRC